jgi:RND family efflux transporter MFP subunit
MVFPRIFRNYKLIGAIILIIILVVIFRGQIQSRISPGPAYKTSKAEKRNLTKIISASGKVKCDEEAILKFQTSGYLSWVGVKVGDKVKKWQAVASLDKEQLEKELKQELIDYMNERWDYDQTQDDYHTGNQPPEKVAINNDIRRILEKAQFDLNRVVLDVEIKNLALKYATLWTPIDGIVTAIDAPNAGVNITPATASFTISNPDKMIFSAKVDEADIGSVKIGQKAKIFLDAYPDEQIDSEVKQINFTATTTSSGGTAYEVKFSLPENTDQKYKNGMNGDAEIIIKEVPETLAVPYESVREKNNTNYVWVLQDNLPVKKVVETGFATDDFIQIIQGLNPEDIVITSGFTEIEKKFNKK